MKSRNWKKILAFMLTTALIIGICGIFTPQITSAAERVEFTVSADKTELSGGDTVTYTLSMSGNETGTGVSLEFSYDDSVLELKEEGTEQGDIFNGVFMSEINDDQAGKIIIVIGSNNKLENGTVISASFQVKNSAKGKVTTGVNNVELINDDYEMLECETTNRASDVRVVVPATGITLNRTSLSLVKGETASLTADLTPADADAAVTWKSSDPSVAKVENGTVTAVGKGTATITAAAGSHTASCEVTVSVPLNGITITGTVTTLKKGQTTQLEVVYDPADTTDNKTVTWDSSDSSIASVDSNGVVTALREGVVAITAKVGDHTASYEMTIKEIKLTAISMEDEITILRGKTEQLAVTYTPEDTTDETTVTWSSSDPSIASVDAETGKITALKEGSVEITAVTKVLDQAAGQPFTAVTNVTVKENHLNEELAAAITFEKIDTLLKGQILNLYDVINIQKIVEDNQITDDIEIRFSGSEEAIAVIDADGNIRFLKEGTVTVTAVIKARDGAGNEVVYTVQTEIEGKEIPLESISFDKDISEMEVGASETLQVIYHPEDTTDDREVVWSSSDLEIITVEGGKLTAKKVGTAVITATVGEKSVSCEITVVEANSGEPGTGNDGSDPDKKEAGGKNTETSVTAGVKTGDSNLLAYFVILLLCVLQIVVLSSIKLKQYRRNRRSHRL